MEQKSNQPHEEATSASAADVAVLKDGSKEKPIPTSWRPIFCRIFDSFAAHDYGLGNAPAEVSPVPKEAQEQIASYVLEYGATLTTLPEETWTSSVCIWYGGYWDVLVDLWTQEEGRSDMVLSCRVTEVPSGYRFDQLMVYVP
jgi:hypothetical protein